MDYAYISEPPIFADIGTTTFSIDNLSFGFVYNNSYFSNGTYAVDLKDIRLDFYEPADFVVFDGVSDFSEVAQNTVNTLTMIIRNRLECMLNQQLFTDKLNALIDSLTSKITLPFELDLGTNGLYLEAGLWDNVTHTKEAMVLPLIAALRTDKADFT